MFAWCLPAGAVCICSFAGHIFHDQRLISIVTPCYNEELNVRELYLRMRAVMDGAARIPLRAHLHRQRLTRCDRVHSAGDCGRDSNVKVILNARNFGHLRSPMHAFLQAQGDAVGILYADLQDPPELFREMIREWEKGTPIVAAIKNASDESGFMYGVRTAYYRLVAKLTDVNVLTHLHRIRPVRQDRRGHPARQVHRSLSLLPGHDRRTRSAACGD